MELMELAVKLRPLEPLMIRGPGEFDPSSKGVYTYASSLILPRPSTFIGMLFSALTPEGQVPINCLSISNWKSLLEECYVKLLNALSIEAIRGPFIVRNNGLFIPITLGKKILLIDYYQLEYYLLKGMDKYGNVLEQYFNHLFSESKTEKLHRFHAIMKLIERSIMLLEKGRYVIEPLLIDRTGIHLKSREYIESGKIVKEGHMYTAKYIAYPLDIDIIFIMVLREGVDRIKALNGKTIKFGGEKRVAKLTVVDKIDKLDMPYKLLSTEKFEYVVLLSPAPLEYNEYSKIRTSFIGIYSTVGLGFSIAKTRRKPVIPCLCEGGILRVDKNVKDKHDLLRYGLYSLLNITEDYYRNIGRLGFASIIPLNVSLE